MTITFSLGIFCEQLASTGCLGEGLPRPEHMFETGSDTLCQDALTDFCQRSCLLSLLPHPRSHSVLETCLPALELLAQLAVPVQLLKILSSLRYCHKARLCSGGCAAHRPGGTGALLLRSGVCLSLVEFGWAGFGHDSVLQLVVAEDT